MNRTLLVAASATTLALGGFVTAAPAVAEPRCQADCEGPHYNGPLQNTWSHGLTQDPQLRGGGNTFVPCGLYAELP